jgi:hypothetical protein
MSARPDAIAALEHLAGCYASAGARAAAWHGAAEVRLQAAREAGDEGERRRHLQLATLFEARAKAEASP